MFDHTYRRVRPGEQPLCFVGNIPQQLRQLGDLLGAGYGCLRLESAIESYNLVAQFRQYRSTAARTATRAFDHFGAEHGVHRLDQHPCALVAHTHLAASGSDGAATLDSFQEFGFARPHHRVFAKDNADTERWVCDVVRHDHGTIAPLGCKRKETPDRAQLSHPVSHRPDYSVERRVADAGFGRTCNTWVTS